MKIRSILLPLTFICAIASASASIAEVDAIIKKARAHVGTEAALASIDAIQFRGKVKLNQNEEMVEGTVLLTFQKPSSQKIEFVLPDRTMVTGFNGYEGYEFVEGKDPQGKPVRNIRSVGGDELRRNKAAAIENLGFFRPFEFNSNNIKDHGVVDIDGTPARKIDFIHREKFIFTRFFDIQTGDLLRSELETGIVTIETGEMIVGDIKFSSHVEGRNQGALIYEMDFDEIILNPELEVSFFDYPSN